jgi:hypothetical protein
MPYPEIGDGTVAILFSAVLAWAAISDIRVRKIPSGAF